MQRVLVVVMLVGCARAEEQPPIERDVGLFELPTTVGPLEYVEVDRLDASHHGKRVKVHGFVTDDEIVRTPEGTRWRFTIAQDDKRLVVVHTGALPDRFQPRLEVIVTGTLSDEGTTLASDELVAKCPDSYEDGSKPPR
jgi:cytochrome c-type biogenesis protein CcmE